MAPCVSNTTAYGATAETMTADETQLQGGGPGSTFIHSCSSLSSQIGGKRRRKTRKASRKKRRKTKRAGSGMFDTVYDSIFGKQEKPPPKPKKSSRSSDEFEVLDVDPSSAPSSTGPGHKGTTGVPMEDVIDPSDYDSKDLRILGLSGDPTEKQIKDSYREKARKCHPDKVPGKLKEFQKLQGANERVMKKYRMKHPTASKKKRPKKTMKKPKKTSKKTSKKTAKKR